MTAEPDTRSPFAPSLGDDATDAELAAKVLAGDRTALEVLVRRHQRWIYNVAFRMVLKPQDAEDVTQEILIKVLTKLSTFDPAKAAFRTWLFRVVANYVINMRKRGYEAAISSIDQYYSFVADVADEDADASPEAQLVAADLAIGCTMGVLLCLERDQRLAFILAVAFNVSDAQGSEILGISRAGFRKLLSRARSRLHDYMHGNCGVMNPDAPCHCHKKVPGLMRRGAVAPDRLSFLQEAPKLEELVGKKLDRFNREIYADYARVLREHPFYRAPEMTEWVRGLVERRELGEIFELR